MSLYSDLRTYLEQDADVSQITPLVCIGFMDQDEVKPFITIDPGTETFPSKHSSDPVGAKLSTAVEVLCQAGTFEEAYALRVAVVKCLKNFRGTQATTHVSQFLLTSVTPQNPGPRQGQERGDWVISLNYSAIAAEPSYEV